MIRILVSISMLIMLVVGVVRVVKIVVMMIVMCYFLRIVWFDMMLVMFSVIRKIGSMNEMLIMIISLKMKL